MMYTARTSDGELMSTIGEPLPAAWRGCQHVAVDRQQQVMIEDVPIVDQVVRFREQRLQ